MSPLVRTCHMSTPACIVRSVHSYGGGGMLSCYTASPLCHTQQAEVLTHFFHYFYLAAASTS